MELITAVFFRSQGLIQFEQLFECLGIPMPHLILIVAKVLMSCTSLKLSEGTIVHNSNGASYPMLYGIWKCCLLFDSYSYSDWGECFEQLFIVINRCVWTFIVRSKRLQGSQEFEIINLTLKNM